MPIATLFYNEWAIIDIKPLPYPRIDAQEFNHYFIAFDRIQNIQINVFRNIWTKPKGNIVTSSLQFFNSIDSPTIFNGVSPSLQPQNPFPALRTIVPVGVEGLVYKRVSLIRQPHKGAEILDKFLRSRALLLRKLDGAPQAALPMDIPQHKIDRPFGVPLRKEP